MIGPPAFETNLQAWLLGVEWSPECWCPHVVVQNCSQSAKTAQPLEPVPAASGPLSHVCRSFLCGGKYEKPPQNSGPCFRPRRRPCAGGPNAGAAQRLNRSQKKQFSELEETSGNAADHLARLAQQAHEGKPPSPVAISRVLEKVAEIESGIAVLHDDLSGGSDFAPDHPRAPGCRCANSRRSSNTSPRESSTSKSPGILIGEAATVQMDGFPKIKLAPMLSLVLEALPGRNNR